LTALILVAHGSKNPKFQEMVMRVAKKLEERVGKVYVGFLIGHPTVTEAVKEAAKENEELVIVPFFIAEGSHVVRDLKKSVETIISKKRIRFARTLGDHPLVIEALYQRYLEALQEMNDETVQNLRVHG